MRTGVNCKYMLVSVTLKNMRTGVDQKHMLVSATLKEYANRCELAVNIM